MYFAKLAQEYHSDGITVLLHCPGYVKASYECQRSK